MKLTNKTQWGKMNRRKGAKEKAQETHIDTETKTFACAEIS